MWYVWESLSPRIYLNTICMEVINENVNNNINHVNVHVNMAHPDKETERSKSFYERIGKTGKTIGLILAITTGTFTCWQIFKSSTKHKIAGAWKLKFIVQSSSYKPYIGESHTQRVSFCQNDCEITGEGEKWEYNGKLLPFDSHRILKYKGNIDDDCLKATYELFGLLRKSDGNIEVTLSDDGRSMEGKFTGTAGDSKGTVTGERID